MHSFIIYFFEASIMNIMNYYSSLRNKLEQFCKDYFPKKSFFITCYSLMKASITTIFHHYIIPLINPFSLHLCYFLVLPLAGFLSLKVSKTRTSETPSNLDLFFTSVSAATASSMTTVEMEVFSNDQLIVMTILMLLGGEVFTSMLGLHLRSCEFPSIQNPKLESSSSINSIELGMIKPPISTIDDNNNNHEIISNIITTSSNNSSSFKYNKNKSIKLLGYVVLGYIIIVHLVGSTLITMYMSLTPSALNVLNNKGLVLQTFSFFMVVSTFSSCGFAPTNENMMIFRMNNPGLLLILLPYTFVGNTMYPLFLRLVIWVLEKLSKKKEFNYILKNYEELEYGHLMSSKKCWYLGGTTIVFLVLQIVVFCGMDWSSQVMEGMSSYEKFVASLFQTANTRHSGESVVDISQLSQAVLVLFTIMMYLPPYLSFLPIGDQQEEAIIEEDKRMKKQNKNIIIENILFSQLSYLVIFVMIICITERKSLKEDPLNFTVLNIVFEVISAYGNVGLSTGYSCKRRLKTDEICQDKWYGFCGRWSNGGKFALIIVMFYGRLKSFSMHGGNAWRILS